MLRQFVTACAAACLLGTLAPAAMAQEDWDGLSKVEAKRLDALYLLPGADFRSYNKVILDPTEVAFRKDWRRDRNTSSATANRFSEGDMRKAIDLAKGVFEESLQKAYTDAGYTVVTEPGPDVLRVRTAVINMDVAAPDMMTAGRSVSFSKEAGEATLVIEVRDSESGQLLGRALDRREAGDSMPYNRNSTTNRADFSRLFRTWAKFSAEGLTKLKATSPIGGAP